MSPETAQPEHPIDGAKTAKKPPGLPVIFPHGDVLADRPKDPGSRFSLFFGLQGNDMDIHPLIRQAAGN
jgi:hypothetical protein